ncbi:MAG: hypothetical protein KJO98_13580 [Rhodothermia bacterium]|nr:hypothetical protein [Rhodothermia bacterium]
MRWRRLGRIQPEALEDTRLQLHWAAQIPASLGYTFANPEPDWSHTSLRWNGRRGALMGTAVGSKSVRAGIDLAAMAIIVIADGTEDSFPLQGKSLSQGYQWLWDTTSQVDTARSSLVRPDHEMPEHPVGDGATFDCPKEAREELSAWFSNANRELAAVARNHHHASTVRCWPHHFDIATLIRLDPNDDSEEAPSIGAGMSPGDGGRSEPYFYVTPWPYPDPDQLPELPAGDWNREGWVGAVLTSNEITSARTSRDQQELVNHFLDAAIAASRRLL